MAADWDRAQYERFRDERRRPFEDLFALIDTTGGRGPDARPIRRIVDLGCGTGELTRALVERLPGARAEGIDSSPSMLSGAEPHLAVALRPGDISAIESLAPWDLVFSHAALHWVPDHERLLARLLPTMQPGAQLAIQVPKNERHAAHLAVRDVAGEEPFRTLLGPAFATPPSATLSLDRYAEILWEHGLREQACSERIYGHVLSSTDEVVEWVKGTTLVPYLGALPPAAQAEFLAAYRDRLRARVGARAPYFFAFRRMLLWGRKGSHGAG